MKNDTPKTRDQSHNPPREGRPAGAAVETYLAPPPPSKGRIVGLDCHPDTFTAAICRGSTPGDMRQISCHDGMSLDRLMAWAGKELTGQDLVLMEAGANSFEICRRLHELGLRAAVLESAWVGRHAKKYADNDRMAAARIVRVYLGGEAPCVWQPDAVTRERRELLHLYQKAVTAHTQSVNGFKSYLNQFAIRPGSRKPGSAKMEAWLLEQREWTALQRELLDDHFAQLRLQEERRSKLLRLIGAQICAEPLMLRCMKLLGIGRINAFALLAIIGDVKRFGTPRKLVAYLGLNPGLKESGLGKSRKVGMGKRGRGDMRHLLIQAAHAVLRSGRDSPLGKWGWKLFARKGHRNVAVAAVARKLATQVWHVLSGHRVEALESEKSYDGKLRKLSVMLGKKLRAQLALPGTLEDCISYLMSLTTSPPVPTLSGETA
jgi:transposase